MSAMDIDFIEYQLSTELLGHEDDVRGICICGDTSFATSSRDKTVRFWSIDPDDEKKRNYVSSKIMLGHTGFVCPLAWIPPNERLPEGGLVSGGNDCLVILWDLKTAESVCTMKGHESQVTGVAVDDNSDIVSTSMDRTIRRWRNGQQVEFWEAHKAPIQTVLKLSSNEIVTGSSDMTLKLWRNNVCTHTFVGHAGTMLEAKYPHIYWTPCAAHCIDLILEDIGKLPNIAKTIKRAVEVCGFIYNRVGLVNMLRKFTNQKNLIRPAKTRFATSFLTLKSINNQRANLRKMFTSQEWTSSKWVKEQGGKRISSTILMPTFWSTVVYTLKVTAPLVDVLRLVDGEIKPAMGYIYEAMDRAKERIAAHFNGKESKYEEVYEIIDKRWNCQLHRPLHAAGYFLNPEFFYANSESIEQDEEVMNGLYNCLGRLVPDTDVQDQISNEITMYRNAYGLFGTDLAKRHWTKKAPDTVRGLSQMPGLGVLSASHDGSVRLWALTGEVLMEMVGHTSLVYSVHAHVSGLIVSGSEDRSLKIWKDGACVQSIEHPGCVWDAKFMENGDIVTACSDRVVRIWTTHKDKLADPSLIESYASQISQYKCSSKTVGGLKLEDLPGLEALQIPGTADGQTKIVREGDNGVAYAWNASEFKWDKIGEVVDRPGDNMSTAVLDGAKFDYVFDVDIGDGEPTRKLPYNRSDNPYTVADKWLLKENLPLSFREQVVEFILQNSGQKNVPLDTSFRDPYTGANAYMPGGPSTTSGAPNKPAFKHIPKKGMLLFDTAQYDGILKKLSEFNSALQLDPAQEHLSLTEIEISRMEAIVKILKDTSHYHCSTFADIDVALLLKLLTSWPVAMVFPVIDVLKMVILHPDGASVLENYFQDGNDIILETIKKVTTAPVLVPSMLTTVRAITNLFKHSCFHQWLQSHRIEVLDAFSSCSSSNKNLQVSYSTLVLNFAVLLIEKRDQEGQAQVLSAALEIAEDENQDVESKFRALVAVGSLMLDGLVKKIALDFDVQSVAKVAKTSKEVKIAEVGADIELLTR